MSKRFKKRRKFLRLGTPVGFSLFCGLILVLVSALYIGVSWAIENAPTVFTAVKEVVTNEMNSITATEAPLSPEALQAEGTIETGSLKHMNTPVVGTPDTSTPTPAPTPILTPAPTPFLSKPLAGKVVGLDPMYDDTTNAEQAAFNLQFALELREFLELRDVRVVLTRLDSASPCSDEDRFNAINAGGCDIAIRICCSEMKSSVSGAYVRSSPKNKDFGKTLSSAYRKTTGLKALSGKKNGFEELTDDVCRGSNCPVGVLYLGNFNGKKDKPLLDDEDFRESMLDGIYLGLMNYYGVKETDEP